MCDYLFTSESVTEGHPDKLCDKISDAILDDLLRQDPASRVAVETFAVTGLVLVGGEVTTEGYSDVTQIVREVILETGYGSSDVGLDGRSCGVAVAINKQSSDIAGGVDNPMEVRYSGGAASDDFDKTGAGDQGLMFGYACRDTDWLGAGHEDALMPIPIYLSHLLARRLADIRKAGVVSGLRPDGKTQVTMRYGKNGAPRLHTVLVSAQHDPELEREDVEKIVAEHVFAAVVPDSILPPKGWDGVVTLVNPSGRFVQGGPFADTGMTGRKIIVDTYGGMARHGGGAFSGKDATKVDRSGSYYARYVAKNLVAAGAADRLEVQVAYAIGRAAALSLSFNDFGTAKVPLDKIYEILHDRDLFDFRPAAIIHNLELRRPIFSQVSNYGHFGRTDLNLPWERTDLAERIKKAM